MSNLKYKRWQFKKVKQSLKSRRVLILSGARQCGKTTLAKELVSKNTIYRTLDDPTLFESALNDPQGFVKHDNELMIVDEVQRVPELLKAIKQSVDNNPTPGRYLLTGSANIQSLPAVNESLAGRVRKVRLRPLSLGEIYANPPNFLLHAFNETFDQLKTKESDDKDSYISKTLQGGYPEALSFDQLKESHEWYLDYTEALLERDLKDLINIKRQNNLKDLLYALAAWSSKLMQMSSIGANLSLTHPTLSSYINALEALYLVERVKPFSKTDYSRISKQDKLFMTDSGLMSAILRWSFDRVRLDGEKNGKLLETFVFTQLAALIDVQEENYDLYHYRDREKREVDFIIRNEQDHLLGIEVKASSRVHHDHFKHLIWFKNNIAKNTPFIGIIIYTGQTVVPFGEKMWAIPMNRLWG